MTRYTNDEGQLVEHGDLLSGCKYAQEGRFGKVERERDLPNPLLITGGSSPSQPTYERKWLL